MTAQDGDHAADRPVPPARAVPHSGQVAAHGGLSSLPFFLRPEEGCVEGIDYSKEFSHDQDVVLVTGGASGIGRLIAQKFSQLGSTVIIWDVNKEAAEKGTPCFALLQ